MPKKKNDKIFGKKLKYTDFKYHDQHGFDLPAIALGVKVPDYAFDDSDYGYQELDFKPGRKWLKIAHQTAGICCHQKYIIATIVEPKSTEVLKNIIKLSKEWDGSNAGFAGVPLREVNKYEQFLNKNLNVSCNFSWRDFEEAIYPIDVEHLKDISSESFPSNLDDLVNWKDGFQRGAGCIGRWNLWILTENSD